eukprot:Mrub_05167.p1 GENE.Mrub_05167~~Mrub_05167.p1  ORF type:complete len:366 (+),score=119.75 Mrub_05167:130-1098(+)
MNKQYVYDLKNIDSDATYELNQYSDLSYESFVLKILPNKYYQNTYHKENLPNGGDIYRSTLNFVPDAFDWKNMNKVTRVYDQGSLGTCWAFSAVQSVESAYAIKHDQLLNLSVEQLVECDSDRDDQKGYADCGVFGGWPYLAFEYMVAFGGLLRWQDYPYCQSQDGKGTVRCYPCMAKHYDVQLCGNHDDLYCKDEDRKRMERKCRDKADVAVKVTGYQSVGEDEEEIKRVLVEKGPLSVVLNAALLQFYKGGIFNPWDMFCNKKSLDHAVLLVGYGSEKGTDYWVVKNSWGSKWGEQGYFRIKRGDGKCGINTAVMFPIIE